MIKNAIAAAACKTAATIPKAVDCTVCTKKCNAAETAMHITIISQTFKPASMQKLRNAVGNVADRAELHNVFHL